jgi:GNAT superfamily N-acetyltransferase
MSHPIRQHEAVAPSEARLPKTGPIEPTTVTPLTDADEAEVRAFLRSGSVDTVVMCGLIADNGLESPFNRGTFYAARDAAGELVGVALIGHATLVETEHDDALAAFARLAQRYAQAHVVLGVPDKVERFWWHYGPGGQTPRLLCRELFLDLRWPLSALPPVPDLRRATLADLPAVLSVNARLAFAESGVNPLERDPEGFRLRVARRVEQGRIWVWCEHERLMFKADLLAETPQLSYLEGIYVHPDERGKGYGARCLSQLGRDLLRTTDALCLLVNEQNKDAQRFFFRNGFKLRDCYDTIFLRPREN